MKSALKVKFDEYKDFLSRILKIIQSNQIIIKKLDMNKKIWEIKEDKHWNIKLSK